MELYEQIEREWEKHEDIGEPKGERTYIQYENEYYAIKLGALDADYIDSIHV